MTKTKYFVSTLVLSVVLSASFSLPAWATVEGDQTPASEAEIASAIASGDILTEDPNEKREEAASLFARSRLSDIAMTQLAGDTLYDTAVAQARAAYSANDTAIIVGSGIAWVDALSAAGLAGALDCPILFTEKDRLQAATADALAEMGVERVFIVGGTSVVGDGVVSDLEARGVSVEERLWGYDCYQTQMAIYEYGSENGLWEGGMAFVATGEGFEDATSVSPIAFATKSPIFLSRDGGLDDAQRLAVEQGALDGRITDLVVVGGTSVVSELVGEYFHGFMDGVGGSFQRLWGSSQYDTCVEIAKWAVSKKGFSWDGAAFTTSREPYDALAGSVLQGKSKSVLLLVGDGSEPTVSAAASNKASISSLKFFGGKNAITRAARMRVADVLNVPYAALPGFKVYVDAGHGWNDGNNGAYDPGACANGYQEAVLTAELANMVGDVLRDEYGVNVFINDDGGPYKYRHAEAVQLNCDAIVSLHFNAAGGSGSMSLRHEYNAAEYSYALQSQVHPYLISGTTLNDLGMRTQEVAILGGDLPATLLEVCFIDNSYDMSVYQSRKVDIAHKIAEGIIE